SDVCVDAAYATPPLRSDAAPTTTGRPPRDGPWGRGCAEPGCASQPQPGRPWFDGVMIRISREDFEEAVDDALDSLPEEIARAIAEANVAILVEEEPAPEQSGGTELLGLYEGIPLDKRSIFQGYAQPDRIVIFRGPLPRAPGRGDRRDRAARAGPPLRHQRRPPPRAGLGLTDGGRCTAPAARGAWSDLVGVEVGESGLVGDDRDLHAVGAVELREDLRDARLHGRLAHEQPHRDLGVGQPRHDRADHHGPPERE